MNKMYQKTISDEKTSSKRKFGGFAFVELLVVVLIIGILAAIAVPGYQKVVKKNRALQLQVLIKSIQEAEEAFLLANGTYSQCLNDLDINVLSSFTSLTETDGCVTGASKGTGDSKVTVSVSRYLDNGWLDKGATNWTVTAFLGNYGVSGNGGYGVRFGFSDSQREPISCVEYACHMVEEGSFCRSILNVQGEMSQRDCVRFYHD